MDVRCDVYALGLVAWYLLGGRPPFESASLGQLLNDQINTPLPPLAAVRADLSPDVDAALAKLCAKDADDRPGTMDEVARMFEALRPRIVSPAPLFARGTAHVIDGFAAFAAGSVVALVLRGIGALVEELPGRIPDWITQFIGLPIMVLGATAAAAALLVLPEIWYRTSVGKVLFDLRVVRADGTRPGFLVLFARLALRFPFFVVIPLSFVGPIEGVVAVAAFGLQFVAEVAAVVCYFARGDLTLSDLLTKTRVVNRRDVS